jgi:hypothetical protein
VAKKEGILNDPKAQAKIRGREKRQREESKAALAHVLKTLEGRRFMYDLIFDRLSLLSVYKASDSGIYRHEGRREAGFDLAATLQMEHTEDYILMITERLRDQRVDQQVKDAATNEAEDGEDDA